MDIERLNKLKKICFNKPSQNRKKQPFQSSKSPINNQRQQNIDNEKENANIFTIANQKPQQQKKDHLKEFEKEVSMHYENKQKKLEANIKKFNESIKNKRLERQNNQGNRQNSQIQRLTHTQQHVQSRTLSPARANEMNFFSGQGFPFLQEQYRNNLMEIQNTNLSPIKRANSVNKYNNTKQQKMNIDKSFARGQSAFKSLNAFSIDYDNQQDEQSFYLTSQFGLNLNQYQPIDKVGQYKIQKIKQSLNQLLCIVSQPQNKPIISHKHIEEIRQRLNGAFDRISKIQIQDQTKHLQSIIQGCLYDLNQRIQLFSQQRLNNQSQNIIQELLFNTQDQMINFDLEELTNRAIQFSIDFKYQQGIQLLNNIQKSRSQTQLQLAFYKMKRMYNVYQKQKLFLNLITQKGIDKFTYQQQFKHFKLWKQETIGKDHEIEKIVICQFKTHLIQSQNELTYKSLNTQIDNFIKEILTQSQLQQSIVFLDLIFVNENIPYYVDQNEQQLDLLKQFPQDYIRLAEILQNKSSKLIFIDNILNNKNFNQDFDIPLNVNKTIFLKETQRLPQICIPIYKSDTNKNKKLIIVIRVSLQNMDLNAFESQKSLFKQIGQKIQPLISQYYQSFRKLRKLVRSSNNNNQLPNDSMDTNISFKLNKEYQMLQYIQNKTLELSYIDKISECFKLLQTVLKELFNYDKFTILQYNSGVTNIIYDASNANNQNIGYLNDDNNTQIIGEIIQKQLFNQECNIEQQIIQKLIKMQDKFEMTREKIKDQVIIQLQGSNLFNKSELQNQAVNFKYFVKLEKKLDKENQQQKFVENFNKNSQLFSDLSNFVLALIGKLKAIDQYKNISQKDYQNNQQNEEYRKMTKLNDELKKQLEINISADNLIEELKQLDILQSFDLIQQKLGENIKQHIPNAQKAQLFLLKDEISQILYTYVKNDRSPKHIIKPQNIHLQSKSQNKSQEQAVINPIQNLNASFNTSQFKETGKLRLPTPTQKSFNNVLSNVQPQQHLLDSNRQSDQTSQVQQLISYRQELENPIEIHRVKNNIIRPHSQFNQFVPGLNGQIILHQHQMTHQLDDISSISGCDAQTNPNDKNSFLINTFIAGDNHNDQATSHQRQTSLTRQPSLNLFASQSSTNLQNQIHVIQQQHNLRRDKSAQSEFQTLPQQIDNLNRINVATPKYQHNINFININDQSLTDQQQFPSPNIYSNQINPKNTMIKNNPPQFKKSKRYETINETKDEFLITSNLILETTIAASEENIDMQIQCQNSQMKIIEFPIYNSNNKNEVKSILGFAFESREILNKRNLKNDRKFNTFIDNIINLDEDRRIISENSLFVPLIIEPLNKVLGLIQISNNDKQATFNENDMQTVKLIADKFAKFICDFKESYCGRVLFKKQMEVSLLHTSMENQSVTKILQMANKLFIKSHKKSVKSVYKFITNCENYFKNVFNCKHAQILCVSHERQEIFSFQTQQLQQLNQNKQPKYNVKLIKRCDFNDDSIATALIKQQIQDIVVWPSIQNNFIFIGDGQNQYDQNHIQSQIQLQQYLNLSIDVPQNQGINQCPQTYLAICVKDQNNRVLAIVQLITRNNGFKFVEQDIRHVNMLCEHLCQIFIHIENQNYLQQFSKEKLKGIQTISKIFNKKIKHNYKQLFRELLAFKFGQQNLLKNKIMRKFLDRHLKVDKILIERIQKLANLRKKCEEQNKSQAFIKLRQKIRYLTEKRQKNAQKCIQIVNKYDKLLSIRVKDTVFKFWEQFKKSDLSQITNNIQNDDSFDHNNLNTQMNYSRQQNQNSKLNMYSTFNMIQDQSSYLSADNFMNQSSILDESSITSTLYLKAKAVYKIRRIFNQKYLRIILDTMKIKLFSSLPQMKINAIMFNEDTLRLLKMNKIVNKRLNNMRTKFFNAFLNNSQIQQRRNKVLRRLADKKQNKYLTFGIKNWQSQTENSIRQDLKQEKSYVSMLTEQCKEGTILQMLMIGINKIFQNNNFQSIDECLNSLEVKQLFMNLCENIQSQTLQTYSMVLTFNLPQNYHQSGEQYAVFTYPQQDLDFNKTATNQQLSYLSSINDISKGGYERQLPNHFSSISEIGGNIATTNGNLDVTNQPIQQNIIINQTQQPLFICSELTNDFLFKQMNSHKASMILTGLNQDYSVQQSLQLRQLSHQQSAFIVPMLQKQNSTSIINQPIQPYQNNNDMTLASKVNRQHQLFGTIEFYVSFKSQFEQTQQQHLSQDDQSRFKSYASVVQLGIEQFVHRLQNIQENYYLRLERELLEIEKQRDLDIYKNNSLSHVVNYLSQKVMNTFKADHSLLIFISTQGKEQNKGTYYNFEDNKLYSIDFTGTFFEKMLQQDNNSNIDKSPSNHKQQLRQVTFPSKLVCKNLNSNTYEQQTRNDKFETLTGQQEYEAIKYIPIENHSRSNQLQMFIEIGWNNLNQAQQLHDNDYYLQKKEALIKDKILEHIHIVCQNIKYFIQTLNHKVNNYNRNIRAREYFNSWKRQAVILKNAFTSTNKNQDYNAKYSPDIVFENKQYKLNPYCTEAKRIAFKDDNISLLEATGKISRDNSPQLSNLYFKQSTISLQNPSAHKTQTLQLQNLNQSSAYQRDQSPYHHQRRLSYKDQPISENFDEDEVFSELEVEKAAKRKLVSTSLLFISLLARSMRIQRVRESFGIWQAFVVNTQVAERAFNEILEINHRHSRVRFVSSINIIDRVLKREELRSVMTALKLNCDNSNTHNSYQLKDQINAMRPPTHNRIASHNRIRSQGDQHRQMFETNLLRGIDTQIFEDDVFTIQELDQSLIEELNNNNNKKHEIKGKDRSPTPQGLNMIIVDNDYKSSNAHSKTQSHITSHTHSQQIHLHGFNNYNNDQIESDQSSSNKCNKIQFNPAMGTINDIESEFSLGQGTKNVIKLKADSILEQARNEYKNNKSNNNNDNYGIAFNMRK